jgi:antitoxin VapB
MPTAKLFKNGRSQAVRLPLDYRFSGSEIGISKMGDIVILYPANKGWEILENSLGKFTQDFMATRDQPTRKQRRTKL